MRLFVRSGGGMPGLDIHVGYWLALEQAGIVADECWGTSAGACISALDAFGHRAQDMRIFLEQLTDKDIRDERWFWKIRAMWSVNWFLDNKPIYKLLSDLIPKRGEDYKKPCTVCATDWSTLEPVYFTNRNYYADYRMCVLASMSIAGVFPRVEINGVEYSDGGVRDNIPVPKDISKYDEVWILIAQGKPTSYKGRDTIITSLKRQVDALMYDQPCEIIEKYADNPKVRILWLKAETPKGALHFDHSLIEEAYHYARHEVKQWL